MRIRSKEYDAFGPWIYIIDEEHTMPPLFIPYHLEEAKPLLMLKIPRRIDRRDANPRMNLYDYVIGMFSSYLYVLKRQGSKAAEKKIFYKDLRAIKNAQCLLKGEVFFYLENETIKIDYNTISSDVVCQMIDLIKKNYIYDKEMLSLPIIAYSLDNVEHLYVNLINRLKSIDADMNLVAYQPNIIVKRKQTSLFSKIASFLFNKQYLQSTAFVTNNSELIVIEKGSPANAFDAYYYSHLFLPYRQIKKIDLSEHPKKPELKLIRLKTQEHTFEFIYDNSNIGISSLYEEVDKLTRRL